MQKKVKKYTRSAMYHDIADYMMKNWLQLHEQLLLKGESIVQYLESAAGDMTEGDRREFVTSFNKILEALIKCKQENQGKQPRWKHFLDLRKKGREARDDFLKDFHAFVKKYCIFFLGHWHCKETPKGFETTPRMHELLHTFKERQVTAYIIDEYCTSKVNL